MGKVFYFFVLLSLVQPFSIVAQTSAEKVLIEEQGKFFHQLNSISIDSAILHQISRSVKVEVDSIPIIISGIPFLTPGEREKAIRSLGYFMNELKKNIIQKRTEVYDIPGAVQSYKNILQALLYRRSFTNELTDLPPLRTQVLAATFSQYKEHSLLDDMAVYKRIISSPEFILEFLENQPRFRFTDSLLLNAAVNDPSKFVAYLDQGKQELQDKIRNSKNVYLQQILLHAGDKNASEILPFLTLLAENRITRDSILKTRTDVVKYFQLLVNTMKESWKPGDPRFIFQKLLRKGLKEKSLSFYVNQVNELHSAADATRFASVKGLRP